MNKLNWPTAFVIVVAIIFAGAVVYNKPIGAALGARDGMIANTGYKNAVWQLKAGKVRLCSHDKEKWKLDCTSYTSD